MENGSSSWQHANHAHQVSSNIPPLPPSHQQRRQQPPQSEQQPQQQQQLQQHQNQNQNQQPPPQNPDEERVPKRYIFQDPSTAREVVNPIPLPPETRRSFEAPLLDAPDDEAELQEILPKVKEKQPDLCKPERDAALAMIHQGTSESLCQGVDRLIKLAQNKNCQYSWTELSKVYNHFAWKSNSDEEEANYKTLALQSLAAAANLGSSEAALDLTDAFYLGLGCVKQCRVTATKYLLSAYEMGAKDALPRIADAYAQGIGVIRDIPKATVFLRAAVLCKQPGWNAAYQLYELYSGKPDPTFQNIGKALSWLLIAADRNEDDSVLELGEVFEKGLYGVQKNINQAVMCFQHAAANGSLEGMHVMGQVHQDPPKGVDLEKYPKNLELSLRYFKTAAEAGHMESLKTLADMYSKGENGVPVDQSQAVKLLQAAAQAGDEESTYRLGVLFNTGKWVKRDKKKARELFLQGAENGSVDALAELTSSWKMN